MSKETLAKKHSGDSRFPNTGDLILRRDYIVQRSCKTTGTFGHIVRDVQRQRYHKSCRYRIKRLHYGPILATRLGAGFIPIRKPGKLPAETIEESYDKEYGKDTIQIHKDALNENDVVLLHDDLLATGWNNGGCLQVSTEDESEKNSC